METLQELTHKRNKMKMELALIERQIETKRHEEWLRQYDARQIVDVIEYIPLEEIEDWTSLRPL